MFLVVGKTTVLIVNLGRVKPGFGIQNSILKVQRTKIHQKFTSCNIQLNIKKMTLTERFVYGQISLNVEHRGSNNLRLLKYVPTSTIEHTINTTDSVLRTLKLGKMVLQKGQLFISKSIVRFSRKWKHKNEANWFFKVQVFQGGHKIGNNLPTSD